MIYIILSKIFLFYWFVGFLFDYWNFYIALFAENFFDIENDKNKPI